MRELTILVATYLLASYMIDLHAHDEVLPCRFDPFSHSFIDVYSRSSVLGLW